MTSTEDIEAMRKAWGKKAPLNTAFDAKKLTFTPKAQVEVDPNAGKFTRSIPNTAQPADAIVTKRSDGSEIVKWQDEKVVISRGELEQLYKQAMMEGKMSGNLTEPINEQTRKAFDSQGSFDEDRVNSQRRAAEKDGDLTHIQEGVIERFKKKKQMFDGTKYITSDEVANQQHSTRHYNR